MNNTQHITPSELKDMLPQKPERIHVVPEPRKSELTKACYTIIGCIFEVSKQYRLGLVSTKTLSHDIRRFWITNVLGKEDPYLKKAA